jgi:hypothetical protein
MAWTTSVSKVVDDSWTPRPFGQIIAYMEDR